MEWIRAEFLRNLDTIHPNQDYKLDWQILFFVYTV